MKVSEGPQKWCSWGPEKPISFVRLLSRLLAFNMHAGSRFWWALPRAFGETRHALHTWRFHGGGRGGRGGCKGISDSSVHACTLVWMRIHLNAPGTAWKNNDLLHPGDANIEMTLVSICMAGCNGRPSGDSLCCVKCSVKSTTLVLPFYLSLSLSFPRFTLSSTRTHANPNSI